MKNTNSPKRRSLPGVDTLSETELDTLWTFMKTRSWCGTRAEVPEKLQELVAASTVELAATHDRVELKIGQLTIELRRA